MENKDLAQKIQAILSETPKMIHKCIEDGEQARAFRILSDYANQRVIEVLENIKLHLVENGCNDIFDYIGVLEKELKQE